MTAETVVIGKALADACDQVRDGRDGDALRGPRPAFVAAPGSTREAAAVLRAAAGHELAVVVRGGGSRSGWGAPVSRCDLVLDTSRLSGVVEHAAGDLVARIGAGTSMGEVAEVLARAGQEIALDVPAGATVGGVVASALAGPRRLRYGTPRDLLIGITVVRADGTIAKSGGKVVKNVAGYDLGKLFAGSAGTLGLITEATFRLHPRPAARAYVTAQYVAVPVAADAVAAAANSPLTASAVELSRSRPDAPIRLCVLLEGTAEGVGTRATRMAALLGNASVADAPPPWWPGSPAAGAGQTLVQVSFWVSALGRVLDAISAAARKAGVTALVDGSAGAGLLYARVGAGEQAGLGDRDGARERASLPVTPAPAAVAGFVGELRNALAAQRGAVTVLAAPAAVGERLAGRGGLYGAVPGLALMQAVKYQFDPGHRMAPGRFPDARGGAE